MTDTPSSNVFTLLFTDLAGSTALKSERGDRTGSELIGRHRAHVQRLVTDHHGRIVDFAGDGTFSVFTTPSAAIDCALALQAVHSTERDLPGVRIGAHLGEVSASGDRVEGLAVDIAARIQSIAHPGQVLMSSIVADSARQRLPASVLGRKLRWKTHGAFVLKGAAEPINIVEVGLEGIAPLLTPAGSDKARPVRRFVVPAAVSAIVLLLLLLIGWQSEWRPQFEDSGEDGAASAPIRSLAVLPLDNLSGDPAQEYFSDGMTETLIAELAKLPGVRVTSRTSVMAFKGTRSSLTQVAEALDVDGILEGSVMRSGDRVRITAQLIDARADRHLWSEQYDRNLVEVFELQSEVAADVAKQIQLELTPEESSRFGRKRPVSAEAQEHYFQGLKVRESFYADRMDEAILHFRAAIAAEPDFALAHAALSSALLFDWSNVEEGRVAALHAVLSDPGEGAGFMALGSALAAAKEWSLAARAYALGEHLGHDDPLNSTRHALLLQMEGRYEDSFRLLDQAIPESETDPFFLRLRAFALISGGRLELVPPLMTQVIQRDPENTPAYLYLATTLERLGRFEEAIEVWRKKELRGPELIAAREIEERRHALQTHGSEGYIRVSLKDPDIPPYFRASFMLMLGENEAALDQVKLLQEHDGNWYNLSVLADPAFKPLHALPGWKDVLRKMNRPIPESP